MKNCKDCLYKKVCPHLTNKDAERCGFYDPKEDYVKVVRCKDCAYRDPEDGWCRIQAGYPRLDEYCSHGQKKVKC